MYPICCHKMYPICCHKMYPICCHIDLFILGGGLSGLHEKYDHVG
ncbi:hypothetical protein NC651_003915 [Populus alba x Populus x berolinensis]|nr:hypothetical protein NC651_003915 [Populus alba x Populus x berolinensis]